MTGPQYDIHAMRGPINKDHSASASRRTLDLFLIRLTDDTACCMEACRCLLVQLTDLGGNYEYALALLARAIC